VSSAPGHPRAICFVDGQNLFHGAREQFGHSWPDYDVLALSNAVCGKHGWVLQQVRFYTGIPERRFSPDWNEFWVRKLSAMGNQGIHVHSRHLRHRVLPVGGSRADSRSVVVSEEKGIDVRIAIDVIRLASKCAYDVALLFSQDQDFAEAAIEVREIAREQNRWIKIACAFPARSRLVQVGNRRDRLIPIDRETYEACLDRRDYRSWGR
jgi:uncharacterized LabA/DUF88 family protein